MDYDFSSEFPGLFEDLHLEKHNPKESFESSQISREDLIQKIEYWKDKYIAVLERYNKLLNERLDQWLWIWFRIFRHDKT